MTDLAMGSGGSFEIGRVIERTFGVIGANLATLLIMALGLTALPQAIMAIGTPAGDDFSGAGPLNIIVTLLGGVLTFVGAMVLQAAVTHASVVDLNGGKPSLNDSLRVGLRNFGPVFGISLLVGLGVGLSAILLIVPGIIAAIVWSVAVPVQVMEKRGVTESMSRSAELTRGSRWPLFGLFFIYMLLFGLLLIISGVIIAALGPLTGGTEGLFTRAILSPLVSAITSLIGASGTAAVYYELRSKKEGVAPAELAAVFD